jgi:hypothetical protein
METTETTVKRISMEDRFAEDAIKSVSIIKMCSEAVKDLKDDGKCDCFKITCVNSEQLERISSLCGKDVSSYFCLKFSNKVGENYQTAYVYPLCKLNRHNYYLTADYYIFSSDFPIKDNVFSTFNSVKEYLSRNFTASTK